MTNYLVNYKRLFWLKGFIHQIFNDQEKENQVKNADAKVI